MKYRATERHRDAFPLRTICGCLKETPSGLCGRPLSARALANEILLKQVNSDLDKPNEPRSYPRSFNSTPTNRVLVSVNIAFPTYHCAAA